MASIPSSPSKRKRHRLGAPTSHRSSSLVVFLIALVVFTIPFLRFFLQGVCRLPFLDTATFCPDRALATWNLLHHLGGNGPWIPKTGVTGYLDAPLPTGCAVDQVHMLSRHAERYPTKNAGARHLDLLSRIQSPNVTLSGSLSFLNTWTYFTNPVDPAFENLTTHGPYAGTAQSFHTGQILRKRYDHLVPPTRRVKFWSCSSPRDVETAEHFADGFFGAHWHAHGTARLEVIPETEDRGADTLTPGDSCSKYISDKDRGHDYGYGKLAEWQQVFTRPIADRLAPDAAGILFSALDIYSMMEMCGFEILARGASPWCSVFTHGEWLDFEYARDLLHFYRAGPGNPYAGAMGWLWLNASQELMSNESARDVFFSFVHDGDIVPVMAALQLLNEGTSKQELPTHELKGDRHWRTSDVVPMGGRLIFERVACDPGTHHTAGRVEHFVRFFINDGLISLPDLPTVEKIQDGVRLADFRNFIAEKGEIFGSFRDVCELQGSAADKITFLHQ